MHSDEAEHEQWDIGSPGQAASMIQRLKNAPGAVFLVASVHPGAAAAGHISAAMGALFAGLRGTATGDDLLAAAAGIRDVIQRTAPPSPKNRPGQRQSAILSAPRTFRSLDPGSQKM